MTMLAHRQLPPSAQDAAMARVSGQVLSPFVQRKASLTLKVREAGKDQPLELPSGLSPCSWKFWKPWRRAGALFLSPKTRN